MTKEELLALSREEVQIEFLKLRAENTLSYCSYCTKCYNCNYCTDCSYCSYCTDCTDCTKCYNCIDCNDCSYCTTQTRKSYMVLNIQLTEEEYKLYKESKWLLIDVVAILTHKVFNARIGFPLKKELGFAPHISLDRARDSIQPTSKRLDTLTL